MQTARILADVPLQLLRWRWSAGALDALSIAMLTILAAVSFAHPFDAGRLLSADALYPIQLVQTPFWEYRPPTPNRMFPDVSVHYATQWFISDLLTQKIVAGSLLLLLMSLVISATIGTLGLLVVLALTCAAGFGCLDSAAHYSLPLLVILVRIAPRPWLRSAMTFVAVFSDPIVLLPLSTFYLLTRHAPSRAEAVSIGLAFFLNTLYSELSASTVHIILVLPVWIGGFWFARRLGLFEVACLACCTVLVAAAWLDIVPARYGLPVSASIVLLFFRWRLQRPGIRAVLWPVAIAVLFVTTMDTARSKRLTANFDCLGALLQSRGIAVVAADHWTAKPLTFADAAAGRSTRITQVGFDDGRLHPWMAPHSAYGPQTVWAVGNRDTCARITDERRYCGQARVAPIVSAEPVCEIFDLYRYAVPIPNDLETRPTGKLNAIRRNFNVYLQKSRVTLMRFF